MAPLRLAVDSSDYVMVTGDCVTRVASEAGAWRCAGCGSISRWTQIRFSLKKVARILDEMSSDFSVNLMSCFRLVPLVIIINYYYYYYYFFLHPR